MLGLLLYSPTVVYIPHLTVLLAFLYIIFFKKKKNFRLPINNDIKIIVVIIILSIINRLLHLDHAVKLPDIIPYIILLIPTYYISINLNKRDLLILINLILLESFVVILEFHFGVSTFFTRLAGYQTFDENALMYFTRPLGLSENSSDVASKLLIAILLIEFLQLKSFQYKVYRVIIIFALILTFTRSALVALVFFYVFFYFEFIVSKSKKYKILIIKIASVFIILSILSYIAILFGDLILMQFTRNNGNIELAGRDLIWHHFFNFIEDNLILGNGSYKLFIPYYQGRMAHAHNSFIELLATNGIIIFTLYMFLIFKNIKINNIKFVFSLFVFSMAQYIIFWGISLEDIVLFYLLKYNFKKGIKC